MPPTRHQGGPSGNDHSANSNGDHCYGVILPFQILRDDTNSSITKLIFDEIQDGYVRIVTEHFLNVCSGNFSHNNKTKNSRLLQYLEIVNRLKSVRG